MTRVVKIFPYTGASQTFTMPPGYSPRVTVHMWGGGGGAGGADANNGRGGAGAGGAYLRKVITVRAGDTVEVCTGGGGMGGQSGTGTGRGVAGKGKSDFSFVGLSSYGIGRNFSGGYGGQPGFSGASGAGGGGGAASAVIVNGQTAYVAAGGAGGGGGSQNRPGQPGFSSNSPTRYGNISIYNGILLSGRNWYSPTWDNIWTVNFPASGTYTFSAQANGSPSFIKVDGNTVLSLGKETKSGTATITAGNHMVQLHTEAASGDELYIGLTVTDSSNNVIFSTGALPRLSNGGNGKDMAGDGAGGGGGGGGITGGIGGTQGADNGSGGAGGYSGTSTQGAIPSISSAPGGADSEFWVAPAGQGGDRSGASGGNGYIVLVLNTSASGQVKVDGEWKNITRTAVKVNNQWRSVSTIYIKDGNEWKEIKGNLLSQIEPTSDVNAFAWASPEQQWINTQGSDGLAPEQSLD